MIHTRAFAHSARNMKYKRHRSEGRHGLNRKYPTVSCLEQFDRTGNWFARGLPRTLVPLLQQVHANFRPRKIQLCLGRPGLRRAGVAKTFLEEMTEHRLTSLIKKNCISLPTYGKMQRKNPLSRQKETAKRRWKGKTIRETKAKPNSIKEFAKPCVSVCFPKFCG